MISLSNLLERVDSVFAHDHAKPDPWPDPHPGRSPVDDEYSRVSDPDKWRIVGARADAWLAALLEADLVTVERNASIAWRTKPDTDIVSSDLARPRVTGGMPLVVSRSRIGSVEDAGTTIGVGDPAVVVAWIPHCGCDACDSGSQDVLEQLDDHLAGIVAGQFRRLERGDQVITVVSDRGHGFTGTDASISIDQVLREPSGWTELKGPSWLS